MPFGTTKRWRWYAKKGQIETAYIATRRLQLIGIRAPYTVQLNAEITITGVELFGKKNKNNTRRENVRD